MPSFAGRPDDGPTRCTPLPGLPRYRLPVDAVLLIFAALAITDIVSRLTAPRRAMKGNRSRSQGARSPGLR